MLKKLREIQEGSRKIPFARITKSLFYFESANGRAMPALLPDQIQREVAYLVSACLEARKYSNEARTFGSAGLRNQPKESWIVWLLQG